MIPIEHGTKVFDKINKFYRILLVKMLQVWVACVRLMARGAIVVLLELQV